MIIQYLQNEGYSMCATTIQDETTVCMRNEIVHRDALKRMIKAVTDGSWDTVAKLASKHLRGHSKSGFLYAICKQEYLELIDRQQYQKAFTYLTTHLKPMEKISQASHQHEFLHLCYLLTCKSVNEVECFKDWEGVVKSRERLVEQLRSSVELDSLPVAQLPDGRLIQLLHQAVAYQMEFSRYHPRTIPQTNCLLSDFECDVLPNTIHATYKGHQDNVKCVTFVGQLGEVLASGSSDETILLWSTEGEEKIRSPIRELKGHTSRIWDLTSCKAGSRLFSASGDGTVKIWNLNAASASDLCQSTFTGHRGDVFSVDLHPHETHLVTGGYDSTIRLFDVQTGAIVKTFSRHVASVCDAKFNNYGNLIFSGSKDGTIRFWDITSGLCIRTLQQTRGEITSVQLSSNGLHLLSGSKNNSNRLWDIRMNKTSKTEEDIPIQRFKGHQNTAKNLIRVQFGPREALVLGGSEDGLVHVWDVATGNLLERLPGHSGIVYSATWHKHQALMATCSHDRTLHTYAPDVAV